MPLVLDNDNFKSELEGNNLLLDFHAVWCGPCRAMKPAFLKAEEFLKTTNLNVKFATVDVDQASDVATLFEITAMPTLVLVKDGKEVDRTQGAKTFEQLLEFVGKHFEVNEKTNNTDSLNNETSNTENLSK